MGNVNSRGDDGSAIFLRDQIRFSISGIAVTSRNRTLLNISPNSFPATRYNAKRDLGDETVIEYVQDPESTATGAPPAFLLRLSNDEELVLNFTFVARQSQPGQHIYPSSSGASIASAPVDTVINGLTFMFGSSQRDIDNLITREFHADPNIHKNQNVELVGDYSTGGSASVQFQWSWRWRPPKAMEDRGGGWRTNCSFVEYDQRAHRLEPLATFSFWVQNTQQVPISPKSPPPHLEIGIPPRLRVPSGHSMDSRISDMDSAEAKEFREPNSPLVGFMPDLGLGLQPANPQPMKVDVNCQRPGEDISAVEDGPLFRATIRNLEMKTANMRIRMKKVLRKAEAAQEAQVACNDAVAAFMEALKEASSTNANAVQPALDHYFNNIAKEMLAYERQNSINLQKLIIDPISKLYNYDIKQAEAKKKDFEEESKEFYSYVGRYLGQRQDSLKEKKRAESDSKYQMKRRNYDLKRFDYSNFMQDLHGGRKDQEVLSQLTRYADAQARGYLTTAKKVEALMPQLEALTAEVKEADKSFQLQRTEREEKRRAMEKSTKPYADPELMSGVPQIPPTTPAHLPQQRSGDVIEPEIHINGTSPSTAMNNSIPIPTTAALPISPGVQSISSVASPAQSKFKGIRDLEEKDYSGMLGSEANSNSHKKEGLLWALSRPGSHVDPRGLNKTAWHKFWIVLDQGKLLEYLNWKDKLDLHMEPIDLRVASVREARNAERRFCFEVITPNFTRVYQATSEEDMKSWISSINNALQSAFEGKTADPVSVGTLPTSTRSAIASALSGKPTSFSNNRNSLTATAQSGNKATTPTRHATVGDRPTYRRVESQEDNKLLQQIREADAGNAICADCGSESKVEWASINFGIVVCIECSGIHRSLGTHISKMRSLTLDTTSFTPDIVELLMLIGNRVSNMIWEARLDPSLKPHPQSTREQRLKFITAKYADKAYVQPISSTLSHYATPDETLLASIKKNDLQNVLYALALRANPNVTDRSRGTHAVFLALAAADPAIPAGMTATPIPPSNRPSTPQRKTFPIAELLLQNGAELPTQPSPIPLSAPAKLYLEFKIDQKTGRHFGGGVTGADTDRITALPNIVAGNGSTPSERAKEREVKLQKRVSAGSKLMRAVASEPNEGFR